MRAVEVSQFGGPEVLQVVEREAPIPGPRQVLVQTSAVGVNYMDTFVRAGARGGTPPVIPGAEGAGRVLAVGSDVAGVSVGDRVGWKTAPNSYAEQVVVDLAQLVPLPESVSEEIGAAVLLQGLTAQYLADSTYPVSPGDVVLVHAAAGGVGLLLTQIATARGGRVVGTVSNSDKAELALDAGAVEAVAYEEAAEAVNRVSGGEGAHAVYDSVGQATFETSLAVLRPHGTVALYGAASGPVPPFDLRRLTASRRITRPSLGDYTGTRAELLTRSEQLFSWIEAGKLRVSIGGRYPLDRAVDAHRDIEGRGTTGKLLLLTE